LSELQKQWKGSLTTLRVSGWTDIRENRLAVSWSIPTINGQFLIGTSSIDEWRVVSFNSQLIKTKKELDELKAYVYSVLGDSSLHGDGMIPVGQ
jgi:hypothetical protein